MNSIAACALRTFWKLSFYEETSRPAAACVKAWLLLLQALVSIAAVNAKTAMAALQQQSASPEEALVDKVLGAEQPTGRLYRGLITALRDDAETAEGLAAARKILKALAARAPASAFSILRLSLIHI